VVHHASGWSSRPKTVVQIHFSGQQPHQRYRALDRVGDLPAANPITGFSVNFEFIHHLPTVS
jgi:hypothetical protein